MENDKYYVMGMRYAKDFDSGVQGIYQDIKEKEGIDKAEEFKKGLAEVLVPIITLDYSPSSEKEIQKNR